MEIRYRVAECERIRDALTFRKYVTQRLTIEAAREMAGSLNASVANDSTVFLVEGAAA